MAQASATFHEDTSDLRPETMERHRAIVSLMEELEAVDWYDQRIDATSDEELREVLRHNRDEEKEHAAMTLEWLRRHDPELDRELRRYLFTDGPILDDHGHDHDHEEGDAASGGSVRGDGSLGIGGLSGRQI